MKKWRKKGGIMGFLGSELKRNLKCSRKYMNVSVAGAQ